MSEVEIKRGTPDLVEQLAGERIGAEAAAGLAETDSGAASREEAVVEMFER